MNVRMDAGLLKVDETDLPYMTIDDKSEILAGQWCLATGHPGGYEDGRKPVVRLGRVWAKRSNAISKFELLNAAQNVLAVTIDHRVVDFDQSTGPSDVILRLWPAKHCGICTQCTKQEAFADRKMPRKSSP